MTTTLDPALIDAVHEHMGSGGKTTASAINAITGGTTKDDAIAYVQAAREKYPKEYVADEEPEIPDPTFTTDTQFKLLNEKGILQPLVVVKAGPSKVILKFDEPTDIVVVQLKGKSETLDLFQLRKVGAVSPFEGVSVQTLLMMGELAK